MSLIGKLARQFSIEERQTRLMACLSDLAATNAQVCQLIISYRRDGVGFSDNTGLTHEQEKMIAFIVSHSALIRGESFANGTVMLLVVKHPITAVSYNIPCIFLTGFERTFCGLADRRHWPPRPFHTLLTIFTHAPLYLPGLITRCLVLKRVIA